MTLRSGHRRSARRGPGRAATLVGSMLVVVGLAACAGGSPPAAPAGTAAASSSPVDPSAKVTLSWWSGQSSDAQKVLEGVAKKFSAEYPNVTIEASSGASTTDDLLTKITAGFAANTYPDISYAYGSWATELATSGRTLDLTASTTSPEVKWEEFPQSSRALAAPQGTVIGYPAVVGNLAVIYNPALFAAAGVPEPTPDWTWEDFRATAKKLTDPAKNVYGTAYSVAGTEDTTWHFWPLLWQWGGEILTADGKKSAFNSQAGVDALTFLKSMAVDDKSVYLDQTDEKYGPLFVSQRIGMIVTGPWQLYDLVQAKKGYKVVQLPGRAGNHETVSATDLWVGFDHKDPLRAYWAAKFLALLTTADVDAEWNLGQGNLPLRSSEAAGAAFTQYVKDYPGADVFVANLGNAKRPRPSVPGYVELSRYVGGSIAKVLQGAADPKTALDDAAKKADAALADG